MLWGYFWMGVGFGFLVALLIMGAIVLWTDPDPMDDGEPKETRGW